MTPFINIPPDDIEIRPFSSKLTRFARSEAAGNGKNRRRRRTPVPLPLGAMAPVCFEFPILKVDGKSNEITAIRELLKLIDVEGSIVSIAAMGTQTSLADLIVEKGADYILALNGNQANFHSEVALGYKADAPY